MISATAVYTDCSDRINVEENGQFSLSMFNRFSRLAELRLIEWISGDISAIMPPEPFRSQKNADWLSPFITKYPVNVAEGIITRPDDYYLFQNIYDLTGKEDCGSIDDLIVVKKPITVLSAAKFQQRAITYIKSLKPSIDKPIAKQVGKTFEFLPEDIGSVVLEYVRYPKFASIATKVDQVYFQEIPDEVNTINYEWDEWAREILVFFICDAFANRTREQALKSVNIITGKTIRDSK